MRHLVHHDLQSLFIILDRFRWVYCQLDTLRRCMPSSIRKALNELPISLDDTYERMLQGIPNEKFEHASRLFQCMVAAIRPLRVEELAELFAIEFSAENLPNLVPGWRPENPEEAVLSTCSTFITIVDGRDSKIVQFSHFSVKEFLTSDRLQLSNVGNIRHYHIPLEPAHAILARACVTILLQVDEKQDEEGFGALPLGSYAIDHWARHATFGGVPSQIEESLAYLFDPKMPHFKPRRLLRCLQGMHEVYPNQHSFSFGDLDRVTPLFLAAFCGFSGLVKHLIITHVLDVNADCGLLSSPLHGTSENGQVDSARILLDNGADVNARCYNDCTPLHLSSYHGYLKVTRLLLEQGARLDPRAANEHTPLCMASDKGHLEVVRLLLDHGADVNVRGFDSSTPYQLATQHGHDDVAQLLLGHGAK